MSPPPAVLRAALRFGGGEITVDIGGEIDLLTAPPLASVFVAVAGQGPGRLIRDLADVEFMGVSGLNLIATLASRLRAADGEVVVRITAEAAAAHLRRESRRVDIPLGRLAAELVAQTGQPTSSEPR